MEGKKSPWIPSEHAWRWRLITGVFMFLLAFVGVALTVIKQSWSWGYWKILSGIFAAISLGLSAYLKQYRLKTAAITIWHEVFHWLGLIFSIAILSRMVNLGILSPFAASLQALLLLSLATFLAGIYIEKSFLFVGAFMGCFSLVLSYVSLYSYLLFVPISVVFVFAFYWFIRKKSHQMTQEKGP
ncbi:MAG: hypothetical protein K2Y01_05545 [Rhabdochlamydiaceae bacterium]|nr:hypothetical protein [Rhabdochlamydiaceae bacterium]